MKSIINFAILLVTISVFVNNCSISGTEVEKSTIQFYSQSEELLEEGSIQITIAENDQEITLDNSESESQLFTVSPDTFAFEFSFKKYDTEQLISQGNATLVVEQNKEYTIALDTHRLDTTSNGELISYGGCFGCLSFNSYSINHSKLDSKSPLFNHRLLIKFFDNTELPYPS
ncbi:hypothetical protein [Fodinibius saliphilus]|uniref:hypothetical protein n=1 Tax=Fodinibius saliphilus TaxID=1920650 RepID=UPI001107B9C0|nr:hypothetical protein [Fodinibius saliphilus]